MHPYYAETVEKITAWATQDDNIKGALVLGSQVRQELAGNEWSDLDVLLLVAEPDLLIKTADWLDAFGEVVCVTFEKTHLDFMNLTWDIKRALFADHRAVDFSILPYARVDDVLFLNKDIHAHGYQVIYEANTDELSSKIEGTLKSVEPEEFKPPTADELAQLISDLLFQIIWSFKKIKRKELWAAVTCINGPISHLLLQLIELHTALVIHRSTVLMYEGRFFENRAGKVIIDKLRDCFAKYDEIDAIATLGRLIDMTYFIAKEIGEINGYQLNTSQFEMISKLYGEMKA